MVNSMTGFAAVKTEAEGERRAWEIRSVNGRGLDIRLRLPEGYEALDPILRKELGARFARGNVSVNLRVQKDAAGAEMAVNPAQLDRALAALGDVAGAASGAGLALRDVSAAEILAIRGVFDAVPDTGDQGARVEQAKQDIGPLLDDFAAARAEEGRALHGIISAQLDGIEDLVTRAGDVADARAARVGDTLRDNVARLLGATDAVDENRLAQELALLAVKGDVTEELDRLKAHVAQARGLLDKPGAIGRKLDFLMQEFNREANTLCSKSSDTDLTALGLDLKTLIDQMREQVQNVE